MAEIIFVNKDKEKRAKGILDLVLGVVIPKSDFEIEQKNKFSTFLSETKIDPKTDEALPFIYGKLGGLARSPSEQKDADKRKAEIKAKGRKRMIEG